MTYVQLLLRYQPALWKQTLSTSEPHRQQPAQLSPSSTDAHILRNFVVSHQFHLIFSGFTIFRSFLPNFCISQHPRLVKRPKPISPGLKKSGPSDMSSNSSSRPHTLPSNSEVFNAKFHSRHPNRPCPNFPYRLFLLLNFLPAITNSPVYATVWKQPQFFFFTFSSQYTAYSRRLPRRLHAVYGSPSITVEQFDLELTKTVHDMSTTVQTMHKPQLIFRSQQQRNNSKVNFQNWEQYRRSP